MNDKVNVCVIVPEINMKFNMFLPISKRIGTIVNLLNKVSNGDFPIEKYCKLYNADTLQIYNWNYLLYNTDIRNGTRLVLLSK